MKRLISSFLILWSFSLTAGLPPNVIKGQDETIYKGALKLEVPSSQAVNTGSSVLIDTGNDDILIDGSMEASGVTAWTCTVGTCTKTSVAGEFSPPGKQALKVALSAQAMNVSQSISTVTGSLTQYVIGVKYRVPVTMADFQICTLIAGAEKTCVPSANLILDDAYHSIEIPEVITPGSTVGIKFKTTSAYTANAFFDKAYIKQGLGAQTLQLDNVYSASVVTTSGSLTNLNKSGWISGCTAANPTVCTISPFTVTPNCSAVISNDAAGAGTSAVITALSSTSVTIYSFNTTTGAASASRTIDIICQKSGNDYLSSSSAVYSQASANYGWTAYTPTIAGIGTPATNIFYYKREGDTLHVRGYFVTGTTTATTFSISLPSGMSVDSTKVINSGYNAGIMTGIAAGTTYASGGAGPWLIFPDTATSATVVYGSSGAAGTGYTKQTGSGFFGAGQGGSVAFSVPIVGWSNSAQIVGSFQGYNSTNGVNSPKLFSANITTTSGAVANQYGSIISSCTAANPTVCTLTGLTGTPNCGIGNTTAAAQNTLITAKSSSSITISTASASQTFDLFCQGQ